MPISADLSNIDITNQTPYCVLTIDDKVYKEKALTDGVNQMNWNKPFEHFASSLPKNMRIEL